jgi:citrate synthase
VILGSSESAGRFLADVATRASTSSLETAAREVITEYRSARRSIPGYGHPQHKAYDPRARRLLEVATDSHTVGMHIAAAREIERLLPSLTGKPLAMNVSGAIPAVLLDAGYPLLALKGVPILARTASLVAHLLEEQERPIGFVLAHAAASAIEYDGLRPEGFEASRE